MHTPRPRQVNAKNFLEKRYNEEMELDDAVHTALLTLREGFEGCVRVWCVGGPGWWFEMRTTWFNPFVCVCVPSEALTWTPSVHPSSTQHPTETPAGR